MSLQKPYYRIIRSGAETDDDGRFFPYVLDHRYCQERSSLCRAYQIIQKDLERLFEYIEPCDANKNTYSHRTFELLLRASTEFEANCKGILLSNGYFKPSMKITDYWKINQATKLSKYKVILRFWHPNQLVLEPFDTWENSTYTPLEWYQAYNVSKHNRDTEFHLSSFENTVKSIAALFCVLYAQFGVHTTSPQRYAESYSLEESTGWYGLNESIFDIMPPQWSDAESYNFDWRILKNTATPFEKFLF